MSAAGGPGQIGVRIAGVGSAVPARRLTNLDLEGMVDTSDEWIVQRTGVRERRIVDPANNEGTISLSAKALSNALDMARVKAAELDLIIVATVTAEMTCPSTACRVSDILGATPAPAFDLVAACCGFVYAINVADSLIRSGRFRRVGVVGCDTLSTTIDYTERTVSILFGDAAGSAVLEADADPGRGCLHQSMYADGSLWPSLYMPRRQQDVPPGDENHPARLGCLRMNGREVYKFAVGKFQKVLEEALVKSGHKICDFRQIIVHQSNARMIEAIKERMGLPDDKVYMNIDHYGNSSAGSVGLCLDELWRAGKIEPGDLIMMVAFGGGMTWSASVWKV